MGYFHERLRGERERLGLSQTAMGEVGGVRKQAQHLYESGARSPDATYLSAVAAAGVDVQYVLTGVRSANVAEVRARLGGQAGAPATPAALTRSDVRAAVEGLAEWLQLHQHTLPPAKFAEAVLLIIDVMGAGAGGVEREATVARVMRLVT